MARDELAAWLRLALTDGIGAVAARKLLAAFGLPQQLFAQDHAALAQVAGEAGARRLGTPPAGLEAQVTATLEWLDGAQVDVARWIVTLGDAGYPAPLLQIEDPPLLLFCMGQRAPAPQRAVAVVGSRNPTPQGALNARAFAQALAQAGCTVVSGLALGVDGAAHEGALEGAPAGQLATIAVVGTGLDRVYPKRHLALAHRIAARGVIVSEYLLGTPPLAPNFPRRNRIISGLAEGTLVVEAALESGSLITARMAIEQGKDVFAIPGSIHAPQSRGCHLLLKQGAKLVESAQDVLEELRPSPARVTAPPAAHVPDTPLLQALGFDPVGLDALIARTGIAAPALQAALLELELTGGVARLPGGLYQRIAAG
jgi:DNA processing protein